MHNIQINSFRVKVRMTYFIFKSYRRDETWLEKFANDFNYGKWICNMFE